MKSKKFQLNQNDLIHSIIWAVLFAVCEILMNYFTNDSFILTWKTFGSAVFGAAFNVLKRFITNSNGQITKKEPM